MLGAEVIALTLLLAIVGCAAGEPAHTTADHGLEGVGAVGGAAHRGWHRGVKPSFAKSAVIEVRLWVFDLIVREECRLVQGDRGCAIWYRLLGVDVEVVGGRGH